MKPIKRKLRGAQRVVALQADVLRLRAHAEALEALHPRKLDFRTVETSEQMSVGVAWERAHAAMAELYSFSPKRALALAAKLDAIKPTWYANLPINKATQRINPGWQKWKHEVHAAGIPLGSTAADQRKLKKALAAAKREGR